MVSLFMDSVTNPILINCTFDIYVESSKETCGHSLEEKKSARYWNLKSVAIDVRMWNFGENKSLVNLKTLEVGLYFGKILSDLTPPHLGLRMGEFEVIFQ